MTRRLQDRYPCLKVEGNEITIIGTALLRQGRYELVHEDLLGIKTEVEGKTIILHPDDCVFVYDDTPLT